MYLFKEDFNKVLAIAQSYDYQLNVEQQEVNQECPIRFDFISKLAQRFSNVDSQGKAALIELATAMLISEDPVFETPIITLIDATFENLNSSRGILHLTKLTFINELMKRPTYIKKQQIASITDPCTLHLVLINNSDLLSQEQLQKAQVTENKLITTLLADLKIDPKDYHPVEEEEISALSKNFGLENKLSQNNKMREISKKVVKKLKTFKDLV